ncbi:hypothetical protein Q4I30_004524 [Leishmania utingensis]|uniref:Uncharacterized protein n=1 Tax=Leishmania utingensis TaxID=653362 RepID=A0AAW3AG72_9TRYP
MEAVSATTRDGNETSWSVLSVLHVFHLAHVALTVDADSSSCVEEMSTAELVACVRRLLCMGQSHSSSVDSPAPKQEVSAPYVARALLLRLHRLVEAHERFLAWMRTRPLVAVTGTPDDAAAEDAFLADAAAFLHTLPPPDVLQASAPSPPKTERREASRRSSYAQLLSANLYAISTFVDVMVVAPPGTSPRTLTFSSLTLRRELRSLPQPIEAAALSLLYYLITLTVDVVESSVLCCCRVAGFHFAYEDEGSLVRFAQMSVDFPAATTSAVQLSASPSSCTDVSSLHALLYPVLQQEGSHLLERLLRCEQREAQCLGKTADADRIHRRLLARHVLRRLGHLFFHPLRADRTSAGMPSHTTAVAASDRTDAAIVTWMAEQLQRMIYLSRPTAERERSDDTSQGFSAALAGKEYRPCRFEAESLAELLRLLIAQIDADSSPLPSGGAYVCGCSNDSICSSTGSTIRPTSSTAEGVIDLPRMLEYLVLLSPVIEAAPAPGSGALARFPEREALMKARECVVRFSLHASPQ